MCILHNAYGFITSTRINASAEVCGICSCLWGNRGWLHWSVLRCHATLAAAAATKGTRRPHLLSSTLQNPAAARVLSHSLAPAEREAATATAERAQKEEEGEGRRDARDPSDTLPRPKPWGRTSPHALSCCGGVIPGVLPRYGKSVRFPDQPSLGGMLHAISYFAALHMR